MWKSRFVMFFAGALKAYLGALCKQSLTSARGDAVESPTVQLQAIWGHKFYVYQNPFIGLAAWNCADSIQPSTPGGSIGRQAYPSPGQAF